MTNYPTEKAPSATTSCGRSRNFPAGLLLVVIGAWLAVDLATGHLLRWHSSGLVLLIPLALAVASALRQRSLTGRVSAGHLWWIFGTCFPAVAGLSQFFGTSLHDDWIVPAGLLLIGLASLAGLTSRRTGN